MGGGGKRVRDPWKASLHEMSQGISCYRGIVSCVKKPSLKMMSCSILCLRVSPCSRECSFLIASRPLTQNRKHSHYHSLILINYPYRLVLSLSSLCGQPNALVEMAGTFFWRRPPPTTPDTATPITPAPTTNAAISAAVAIIITTTATKTSTRRPQQHGDKDNEQFPCEL